MTPTTDLLPCPFCDGEADTSHDHTVEESHAYGCRKCGVWFDTFNSDDAVAAWNTRALPMTVAEAKTQEQDCPEEVSLIFVVGQNNGSVERFNVPASFSLAGLERFTWKPNDQVEGYARGGGNSTVAEAAKVLLDASYADPVGYSELLAEQPFGGIDGLQRSLRALSQGGE